MGLFLSSGVLVQTPFFVRSGKAVGAVAICVGIRFCDIPDNSSGTPCEELGLQAGYAGDVVVLEPDPTYEFAATPRATGGIRQLYTVPESILMSQYGHEIYGQFETLMAVDAEPARIDFHRAGYLWLGSGKEDIDALMANWRVQTAHDARVQLLDRKRVKNRFPSMRVDDIDIAP
jgi:hypothetical protein